MNALPVILMAVYVWICGVIIGAMAMDLWRDHEDGGN